MEEQFEGAFDVGFGVTLVLEREPRAVGMGLQPLGECGRHRLGFGLSFERPRGKPAVEGCGFGNRCAVGSNHVNLPSGDVLRRLAKCR